MDPNKRPDDMVRITTPELAQAFIEEQVAAIREQIGDKKVLLALSGGVDHPFSADGRCFVSDFHCRLSGTHTRKRNLPILFAARNQCPVAASLFQTRRA